MTKLQVPENIRAMDEHAMAIIQRSDNPKMSAEEVADALGITPESVLNAAEGGHLPFGFLATKSATTARRTIIVNRAVFYRWYMRYLAAPYEV